MHSLWGEIAEGVKRRIKPGIITTIVIIIQLIQDTLVVLVILGSITILNFAVRATGATSDNWIHMILQASRIVTLILYVFLAARSIYDTLTADSTNNMKKEDIEKEPK